VTDARVRTILQRLEQSYPDAECSLSWRNPLELLVATILSAQCTDVRVNLVTPALFARFAAARDFAGSDPAELEDLVRTTGFFRNKAKSIRGACVRIGEAYGGVVPRTMEDLLTLPGVARKTANVVLGVAFGIADGVVVDTHVQRLSRRLGLTREEAPVKIEPDLMALVPRDRWVKFSHQMIQHGRRICAARSPKCGECPLADVCPSAATAGEVAEGKRMAGQAKAAAAGAKEPASERRRAGRGGPAESAGKAGARRSRPERGKKAAPAGRGVRRVRGG